MQALVNGKVISRVRWALVATLVFAAAILNTSWTVAVAGESDVLRGTLENGLRVIIVRNKLAPVVSMSVNYLVGSDEAPTGFPGMAHAQEHMMFRGSPGLSADQLADIGSMMGGNFNADTRESVTQYLFTVPADDLDVALHIEASRMRGVSDSDVDWDRERGAIEQEVAQDLSNPTYVLFADLRSAMFAGTPYEHDALGTKASFDKTTGMMLKRFHDRWYAPNNAILLIVGDVDPAGALDTVKTLFGGIPAKKLPARPALKFGPVTARSISLESDLPFGMQGIALRMPGLDNPDYAAAEILADVLNSQRGELFGLVPQGKALSTEFSLDSLPRAGIGFVMAAFPAGQDPRAIEQDLRTTLQKVTKNGVPPELVAAAKAQERRQAEAEKNSIEGLASVWAEAVAVDGLSSPDDDLARIEKVTVEDVNRAARKYLDLDHAVFTVLTPRGSGKPLSARGFGGQENIALGEAKPTALPEWAQAALNRLSVPSSTLHPVVSTLSNGMTLVVQPEDVSDIVSVYGHIKNRPELEVPKGQEGLSQVLDQLFSYGTERYDRVAYQAALDDIGAEEHAGVDFSLEVLNEDFDRGIELLAEDELRPALPTEAFETVRSQIARLVAGRLQSPGYLAQRSLRAALYPKDDPTLREALPATIQALSLNDVRAYFHAAFRPDLATVVVIGKITPERAKAAVEKYFGDWKADTPKPETDLPPVPQNAAATTSIPDQSRVQDKVVLSETLGLTRSDPDYYALELGNAVLGGSFYATRLTRDLRKDSGLVYSVGSDIVANKTRAYYLIQYASDPQNVSKADSIVVREFQAMQEKSVSLDELAGVKALLLRKIPLEEASTHDIASGFLERHTLELPLDEPTVAARHYLELGPADVQAAFRKWVRPGDFVRVSQGPHPN
jgi:zinc protease